MMYSEMNQQQLEQEYAKVKEAYDASMALGLKLNMARGKPSKLQLDVAEDVLKTVLTAED